MRGCFFLAQKYRNTTYPFLLGLSVPEIEKRETSRITKDCFMAQEFIELHANDDVLIALRDVAKDTDLLGGIIASDDIPRGHKVA